MFCAIILLEHSPPSVPPRSLIGRAFAYSNFEIIECVGLQPYKLALPPTSVISTANSLQAVADEEITLSADGRGLFRDGTVMFAEFTKCSSQAMKISLPRSQFRRFSISLLLYKHERFRYSLGTCRHAEDVVLLTCIISRVLE